MDRFNEIATRFINLHNAHYGARQVTSRRTRVDLTEISAVGLFDKSSRFNHLFERSSSCGFKLSEGADHSTAVVGRLPKATEIGSFKKRRALVYGKSQSVFTSKKSLITDAKLAMPIES